MIVDIIIPTYNRKFFLKKAIQSILNQSYKNINIIISDNNSNDGTDLLVKKYKKINSNITYYKQKINIGGLKNFKKCLYEYSKSDFLLFLSDDDQLYDEKYIEKAVEVLKKNKNIVITISNTKLFYNDLNLEFNENKKLQNIIDGKIFFLNYGTGDYSISWCNAIFNRKLAIKNDCYNGNIFYADSDCFFRLMMFGNIAFINTIGSIYRLHSKNSYKIAKINTYIKNINYLERNYNFAKKYIDLNDLNIWKNRMIISYWNTVYNNLILFNKNPFKNLKKLKSYFNKNNLYIKKSFIDISILLIARLLMKVKFFHKKMILINNKK